MEKAEYSEKSLAFEVKGGRLRVMLEEYVPTVKLHGDTYSIAEAASVTVAGKKYFVEELV